MHYDRFHASCVCGYVSKIVEDISSTRDSGTIGLVNFFRSLRDYLPGIRNFLIARNFWFFNSVKNPNPVCNFDIWGKSLKTSPESILAQFRRSFTNFWIRVRYQFTIIPNLTTSRHCYKNGEFFTCFFFHRCKFLYHHKSGFSFSFALLVKYNRIWARFSWNKENIFIILAWSFISFSVRVFVLLMFFLSFRISYGSYSSTSSSWYFTL